MKKAQMEMFGLAVVVILVFIGMMFLLMFYMNTPETYSDKEKDYDRTMAHNLVDTVLSLNTTCPLSITEMVKDCYINYGTDQLSKCDTKDSCTYFSGIFNNTLNRTLISWNKPFKMAVFGQDREIYLYENLKCIESVKGSALIPLWDTSYEGEIEINLDVCR
jgi:hypothetical protein